MKIKNINEHLNKLFPYSDAEPWDNVGLFRKSFQHYNVKSILLTLDISSKIIDYAIKNNVNLIISHHPIWIDKKDRYDNSMKKMLSKLNSNKISIISMHTNYDKNKHGMNYQLAKKLNGKFIKKAFNNSYGNIFSLENKMEEKDLIKLLQKNLNNDFLLTDNLIKKETYKNIYICGGSGSSEILKVYQKNKKIDCYITGEIKWNIWNYSNDNNIKIFDVGHNIEHIFVKHLMEELKKINVIPTIYPKLKLNAIK